MKEKVQIGLVVPESLPDTIVDDLLSEIKGDGCFVDVRKEPFGIYATVEWAVPALISAYILKPYFESFLSEAGKDHYALLKKRLGKLVSKAQGIKDGLFIAAQSAKKNGHGDTQSKIVSLHFFTNNGSTVRLIFDEMLSQNDWQNAIDEVVDLLAEHYKEDGQGILASYMKDSSAPGEELIAIINQETKRVSIIGYREVLQRLIEKHRKNSK